IIFGRLARKMAGNIRYPPSFRRKLDDVVHTLDIDRIGPQQTSLHKGKVLAYIALPGRVLPIAKRLGNEKASADRFCPCFSFHLPGDMGEQVVKHAFTLNRKAKELGLNKSRCACFIRLYLSRVILPWYRSAVPSRNSASIR